MTDTFRQECCGGGEYVWVGHDGGVVTVVNGEHVAVWYSKAEGLTAARSPSPQRTASAGVCLNGAD